MTSERRPGGSFDAGTQRSYTCGVPSTRAAPGGHPSPTSIDYWRRWILGWWRRLVGITLIRNRHLESVAVTEQLVRDSSWERQTLLVGDVTTQPLAQWASMVTALGMA